MALTTDEVVVSLDAINKDVNRAIGMHLDPSVHTDLHELLIQIGLDIDELINEMDAG